MLVITLDRKKLFNMCKMFIIAAVVFTLLFILFDQLPNRVSLEKASSTTNDHPGRILRVDFGKQQINPVDNSIQK